MTTLMKAALPSATAPVQSSMAAPICLPPGLTDADAVRIAAAVTPARTESTRTVYAH